MSNLTNILYLIGSLCFLTGSIANMVRQRRRYRGFARQMPKTRRLFGQA